MGRRLTKRQKLLTLSAWPADRGRHPRRSWRPPSPSSSRRSPTPCATGSSSASAPEGATVSQLAKSLSTNKGNVAHHLAVLERAGLVRRGESRQVRGGTEQYFVRAARRLRTPGGSRAGHTVGAPAGGRRGDRRLSHRRAAQPAADPADPAAGGLVGRPPRATGRRAPRSGPSRGDARGAGQRVPVRPRAALTAAGTAEGRPQGDADAGNGEDAADPGRPLVAQAGRQDDRPEPGAEGVGDVEGRVVEGGRERLTLVGDVHQPGLQHRDEHARQQPEEEDGDERGPLGCLHGRSEEEQHHGDRHQDER